MSDAHAMHRMQSIQKNESVDIDVRIVNSTHMNHSSTMNKSNRKPAAQIKGYIKYGNNMKQMMVD